MKNGSERDRIIRVGLLVLLAVFAMCGDGVAQTFNVLVNFDGTNGSNPSNGSLVVDSEGNLWGTTSWGGTNNLGTVFKMSPTGTLTTVYNFGSTPGDSEQPYAPPIVGTDGNLYGTAFGQYLSVGGIVYKLTPSGALTVLHTFDVSACYYTGPSSSLTQGKDGNFYGVTYDYGCGTVFKITPDGTFTNLHTFSGPDGRAPFGALVQGTDGYFYGATMWGGAYDTGGETGGTIFKISSTGSFTSLYSFGALEGTPDTLIQAKDGNFYGVANAAGGQSNIFKMSPDGTVSILASISGSDGWDVSGPLVQGADGNFYGTTALAGAYGYGTIFEMTPTGTLTVLHHFTSLDGATSSGGLVEHPNGQLYGFQRDGGLYGDGTVYTITLGGPVVNLSAPSLSFGNQLLGSTSATQSVTLTNTGNATLNITSIAASGDFSQTNTCGTSVNAGANCSINVTFTPSVVGSRSGTITITDNAPTSPQTINLSGAGAYGVCPLYDQTRSVKSGATFPIKLYLCGASGSDLSSSAVVVHATGVFLQSTFVGEPEDAGNSNPDYDFRFDSTLGPAGGYIFNLKTSGLGSGSYSLQFTAGADPNAHAVGFGVK